MQTPPEPYRSEDLPYPVAGGDPLVPADLRGWIDRIVATVTRSLGPLLQIQLVVAAISAVLMLLFGGVPTAADVLAGEAGSGLGGALALVAVLAVVGAVAACMSVHVVVAQANGEPADLGAALQFAGPRLLPFLGWAAVAGLLVGLGALLVLPAIYLVVVFGAALHGVVIIERRGIGRCFTLVNRRLVPTIGRMALVIGAGVVYLAVVGVLTSGLGPTSVAAVVVQGVLGALAGVVQIGIYVVTYAELRFHEQPWVRTPTLAAELRR